MPASLLARFVGMSIWVLGLVIASLKYHSMALYKRQQALSDVAMVSQRLAAKPAGSSSPARTAGGMHEPL
jgi:hypothetical protein